MIPIVFILDSFVYDQVAEVDLTPELQPLPSSNILMVEVDNVQHEQFTVTEEVKVGITAQGCEFLSVLSAEETLW